MADLAALQLQFKTTGGEQMLSTLDGVASKAKGAEAGVQNVAAASEKASASFGQSAAGANTASTAFGRLAASAATAARNMADLVKTLASPSEWRAAATEIRAQQQAINDNAAALKVSTGANKDHAAAAKLNSGQVGELTHVFRSFVDGLAAGISPMRLMTMEGMRLYQAMSSGEGGLGGGFAALGQTLTKMLPLLAGVGAAAGAAFGTAALAARNLNEQHKDLLDSLGLDEKQLERLKDAHVATTVTIGDVWKGVWTYISQQVDQATKDQQKMLSGWLDDAAHLIARFGAAAVGAFAAGFTIIATVWKELPNVIGEAITGAVNATLKGVQMMINAASDGINKLIQGANALDKTVLGSHAAIVPEFGHVDLGQFSNPNAGAGGQLRSDISGDIPAEAARKAVATYNNILVGMGNAITDAAKKRITEAAGDPTKARQARQHRGPQDTTDQRTAQVDAEVAQAKAQELQAELALVKDLNARDVLQKQINAAELAEKQAQVQRQIASIQNDRGLDAATKAELTSRLEGVQQTQAHVTALKDQLADQQRDAGLDKQAADTDQAARQSHIDLLTAQQGLAKSTAARWALDAQILQEQQEAERKDLQQQIRIATINGDMAEVQKLQAHGQFLDQRQALEKAALAKQQKALDLFDETSGKFKAAGDAFASHDWAHATDDLIDAIRTAVDDFKKAGSAAGKLQSIAGAISGIGSIIGGKFGSALSGIGSGASAGAQIGSLIPGVGTVVGGIVGGLFGGISSLFGGNAKKKQEERDAQNQAAQAAAQAAQQAYENHQALELRLIEASGDALATLNATRQQELDKASAADQALLKQIYDQEARAKRQQTVNDVETEYLTLSGDKVGLLAAQRAEENKSIDATLYGLVGLERQAEDAATALSDAKDALQQAYDAELQRLNDQLNASQAVLTDAQSKRTQARSDLVTAYNTEAAAIQSVIDKFTNFGTSLRAFRSSLDTSAAGLSPQNAYNAASSQFATTAAKAAMGDQQADTDFQGVAQDFLNASASFNGTQSKQYQDDLAAVKAATEKAAATADRTVSNGQQQLDQLKTQVSSIIKLDGDVLSVDAAIKNLLDARQSAREAQMQVDAINGQIAATNALVGPLLGINQGVLSLGQAIANYQAAQQANANAIQALAVAVTQAKANPNNSPNPPTPLTDTGYSSTNGDYAAYVQGNPDLLRLFQSQSGMAKGRTEAEFGVYHWANFGQYENRPVRPYARGGEFMVGGAGGTDSQHVELMASPDEHITVKTPEQMAAEIENGARLAAALEQAVEQLGQLVREAKADKPQRAAMHGQQIAKLGQVVDGLDKVTRSVRGSPKAGSRAA